MICFRDMTFCTSPCANTDCKRMLTDLIRKEARAWWGGAGAPIAVARFEGWCDEHKPKGQGDGCRSKSDDYRNHANELLPSVRGLC